VRDGQTMDPLDPSPSAIDAGDEPGVDEADSTSPTARPVAPGKDESEKLDQYLLRRYHLHGDRKARDQLITMYLPLVRSLARRYASRGEQFDDLVQVGSIGLIKAIDRFDLSRGVELTTYATPNIIGEIKRYFRDKGWSVRVPRGLQELNIRLNKVIDELVAKLQRSPTINEIASAAGATPEEVLEALETSQAYNSVSLQSAPNGDGDDETGLIEYMGSNEEAYDTMEDRTALAPGFAKLEPRERYILHLRFFEGLTQSQIAGRVGISQMHVSRLIRRALEKLRENIGEDAV
jgi:RNA polymerase sigma-B factor